MRAFDRVLRIGAAGASRRLGVVAAVYAVHAVLALAFGWPLARVLANPTLAHPRGDLVLFEPGAIYLTETMRFTRAQVTTAAEGMTLGLLLTLYLGLFPLGVMLCALGREGRARWSDLAAGALRSFGPLSALLGASLLAAALACAVPLTMGELLDGKLRPALSDRGADLVEAGFRVVALAVAATLGVIHDLARAAAVTRELPALPAAVLGAAALRAHPIAAIGAWSLRGLSALLLVVLAARATTHIGIDTSTRLAMVTLLHQAVAFALVFLRTDWLAFAIRLVEAGRFSYTIER